MRCAPSRWEGSTRERFDGERSIEGGGGGDSHHHVMRASREGHVLQVGRQVFTSLTEVLPDFIPSFWKLTPRGVHLCLKL